MRKILIIAFVLIAGIAFQSLCAYGQEHVAPLRYNGMVSGGGRHNKKTGAAMKTTASVLSLPFFEDFTGYSPYPDSNKWVEDEVYVNNTMCVSPISRGVATFDCLSQYGVPYDSVDNTSVGYCDSLTSQPIDLSLNTPADSLYLSFFYQPQGNGFYPTPDDSLQLYLKNMYGDYELVWSVAGSELLPFQQVMIPITDTLYFHGTFQFRFVNLGALNYADADWNVDYIKLDTNRNAGDTLINDIAFSSDPTFLLNDYSSMPYRQFMANPASETATQYYDSVHNDQQLPYTVSYGYSAVALNTGTVLEPPTLISGTSLLYPYSIMQETFAPAYSTTVPLSSVGIYDKVVFENTFYMQPSVATGNTTNDTIVKDQVFDNYLAYDDGTAEKSYYINLSPTLDGRIAVEYHLNQPDTMRGMAIYFGRTTPLQGYKTFSILVYSTLDGINGATTEDTLYTQDYYSPAYIDTINHFWVYTFTTPLALPAGTFYAGTMQYAESGDDSMYIGLDVNRQGPNHVYYNVLSAWAPSSISGALMMRPLLGQAVEATASLSVNNIQQSYSQWEAIPNPAKDILQFNFDSNYAQSWYVLTDITGKKIMEGNIANGNTIDISMLVPGMYFANLYFNGVPGIPKKIIKL